MVRFNLSTFGGVWVKIYRTEDTAEKHEFRERLKYRDKSYVLLKKVKAQPYWFSVNEISFREELKKFSSLGYFIFESSALRKLGISPAPDGEDWVDYRLAPLINGTYSSKLLNIVEIRPESYWRGKYTLWYVFVNEVKLEPVAETTERPLEERTTDEISMVTETVREY